ERDLPLQPGDVEVEQPPVLDDPPGDLAFARGERAQGDRLPISHLVEDREVSRGQDAQVLTVLSIDALDVLRDHQLDPGAHLGVRRLFARRALAPALPAHRGDKAAALDRAAGDGELLAALE